MDWILGTVWRQKTLMICPAPSIHNYRWFLLQNVSLYGFKSLAVGLTEEKYVSSQFG